MTPAELGFLLGLVAGAIIGMLIGWAEVRRFRACRHVYSGHREHVRSAWVRHCEVCGHAEVSNNPIPQPRPNRGANVNPEPTYPRPPAPPAPPPKRER